MYAVLSSLAATLLMTQTQSIIGLYREYAIAIQDEVGDSNGGNVLYVTM